MIEPVGIARQPLDEAFSAEESRKSDLLLAAQMLRAQGNHEEAAVHFAQAARLEEHLSEVCQSKGLNEKSAVHLFSAAGCWAQAGNFFQAISWCNDLTARKDLSGALRDRVQSFASTLSARRSQWYVEMMQSVQV